MTARTMAVWWGGMAAMLSSTVANVFSATVVGFGVGGMGFGVCCRVIAAEEFVGANPKLKGVNTSGEKMYGVFVREIPDVEAVEAIWGV